MTDVSICMCLICVCVCVCVGLCVLAISLCVSVLICLFWLYFLLYTSIKIVYRSSLWMMYLYAYVLCVCVCVCVHSRLFFSPVVNFARQRPVIPFRPPTWPTGGASVTLPSWRRLIGGKLKKKLKWRVSRERTWREKEKREKITIERKNKQTKNKWRKKERRKRKINFKNHLKRK